MAYSILLVVEKPDGTNYHVTASYENWATITSRFAEQNTGIEFLGENVMLIPLGSSLMTLGLIVQTLHDVPYRYTILPEELQWHRVPGKSVSKKT
jgi:hypothetical protein